MTELYILFNFILYNQSSTSTIHHILCKLRDNYNNHNNYNNNNNYDIIIAIFGEFRLPHGKLHLIFEKTAPKIWYNKCHIWCNLIQT